MASTDVRGRLYVHRFAVFTAACTFLLVIAGGLVTSTGSGLSVPDWPLSYGQVMPPMTGGIFYEHGHRMVATFVGILTVILTFWLARVEDRRWVKVLGWVALAAVIVQGVLGGVTVLLLLPTPVSVLHATLAQSFFALMVVIAFVTSPAWRRVEQVEFPPAARTQTLTVILSAAIVLQLVIGAWMRHDNAGLAINDFPLAYGSLLPPTDTASLDVINNERMGEGLAPVTLSQVWIHFAHRLGALLVTLLVVMVAAHILKTYRVEQRMRRPVLALIVLLVVQILLGALTVWTGKRVDVATTHLATGALLLATSVFLTARTFHLYAVPVSSRRLAGTAQPARTS